MDRDTIIRLARESGIIQPEIVFTHLERFAALVAAAERNRALEIVSDMKEELQAKFEQTYMEGVIAGAAAEREACAKVCDELEYYEDDGSILSGEYWAKSIRARGQE
jgi:hypothetical protein